MRNIDGLKHFEIPVKILKILMIIGLSTEISYADSKEIRSKSRNKIYVAQYVDANTNVTSLSGVFQGLAKNSMVSRSVALSDLGFGFEMMLGGAQTQREFFWPVPANIPLLDAEISFNSSYVRADQGRTTLLLSEGNAPVLGRSVSLERGDANLVIPLARTTYPSGFVRFGVDWSTVLADDSRGNRCTDLRSTANLLRVEPTTRLNYIFDAAAIRDLSSAWTALPAAPVILISGTTLSEKTYETAWRIGLTLERTGKRARFYRFPVKGQSVDLRQIHVPDALKKISSFAALGRGDQYVLKNDAEVGAWFALSQFGSTHADIVVADTQLLNALTTAMNALAVKVKEEGPEAIESFSQWRKQRFDAMAEPIATNEIRLSISQGGAAIVVSADAGTKFAGLFDVNWREFGASSALKVDVVNLPKNDEDEVSLKALREGISSLEVSGGGGWSSKFAIDSGLIKGRLPKELVIDLAAAPSVQGYGPVAAIYLNEVLLASKRMTADGKRERVIAEIPKFALGISNTVRVAFIRENSRGDCHENLDAFPATVLPSTHLVLGSESRERDFQSITSRLSNKGEVYVPDNYFLDSPRSLSRLVRISAAAGVSPLKSKFIESKEKNKTPNGSFLALDIGFSNTIPKSLSDKGRLVINDDKDRKLLEISGLTSVGIASVEHVAGSTGVVYRTLVDQSERYDKPFRFINGNFAIIRRDGELTQFDSRGNLDRIMLDEIRNPVYRRYFWWALSGLVIFLFILLLFIANRYRKKQNE